MKAMKSESKEVLLVVLSQKDSLPPMAYKNAERPRHVAPTSLSGLRERPQWVALRGRSGLRFVTFRHGNASDLGASLWQVALRGVSHDRNASDLSMSLWPGRSGMCVTATSQRRSGEVALRPRHVAPTSRSSLRERPQWVALRGRSGLRFVSSRHGNASDLGASLWQVALRGSSRHRNTSDLSMSLWPGRSGMCVTATSRRRSGEVALANRRGATSACRSDKSLRPSGVTSVGRSERSLRASFCVVSPWKCERPRSVTLASRSGLRERPQWVALRGRSGLRFMSSRHGNASDLGASLWQVALRGVSHDRNASDLSMSLCPGRSGMCVTVTSRRRSGEVALVRCSSVDRFKHFF
ncbi:hypothetical protein DY000_02062741 [Brassica cretica]|uniref:Uncharacterized protein n=1 Tax=Brassica cretica TaxID=69181 RepID=A0ABQ7B1N3_BRACR|nr:hypothetical protein DY000_02062741 [Brassica cretica]